MVFNLEIKYRLICLFYGVLKYRTGMQKLLKKPFIFYLLRHKKAGMIGF